MPKELVAVSPRQPVLQEYQESAILEGQVRIQVDFGAPKRGSEMTMYYGNRNAKFPMGLGNMCVGRIVEKGDGVDGFEIGDRVALICTHIVRLEVCVVVVWCFDNSLVS